MPRPEGFGHIIITLRLLVPFKGRLFTSPTGRAGGNPNAAFQTIVYETRDPLRKPWVAVSPDGFGDAGNVSVFEMIAFGDHLSTPAPPISKAIRFWRTRAEGNPPYAWSA